MIRPAEVRVLRGFELWLRFEDGVEGRVLVGLVKSLAFSGPLA